jgi:hypothetical protein
MLALHEIVYDLNIPLLHMFHQNCKGLPVRMEKVHTQDNAL